MVDPIPWRVGVGGTRTTLAEARRAYVGPGVPGDEVLAALDAHRSMDAPPSIQASSFS
jgi:FAD/FMN-containing dehydrogenase